MYTLLFRVDARAVFVRVIIDYSQSSAPRYSSNGSSTDVNIQLRRDLKESLDREADLREQLRFTEEEARTLRRKLRQAAAIGRDEDDDYPEAEEDVESGQKRKQPIVTSERKNSLNSVDKEESEVRMQLESAELEVKCCSG